MKAGINIEWWPVVTVYRYCGRNASFIGVWVRGALLLDKYELKQIML